MDIEDIGGKKRCIWRRRKRELRQKDIRNIFVKAMRSDRLTISTDCHVLYSLPVG